MGACGEALNIWGCLPDGARARCRVRLGSAWVPPVALARAVNHDRSWATVYTAGGVWLLQRLAFTAAATPGPSR
jgi:hypothetical protein